MSNAPPAESVTDTPLVAALARPATLEIEPKQAWTNVADFTARRHRRGQLRPGSHGIGAPPDELVEIDCARPRVRDAPAVPHGRDRRGCAPDGRSRQRIDELWESGELDPSPIEEAIALLDRGEARVAEKRDGEWVVNEWAKKAILLYFRLRKVEPMEVGGLTSSTRSR